VHVRGDEYSSARTYASVHGPQDALTADDHTTVKPQAATAYISTSQGVNISNLMAHAYPPFCTADESCLAGPVVVQI